MMEDRTDTKTIWYSVQKNSSRQVTPAQAEQDLQAKVFSPDGNLNEMIRFIYTTAGEAVAEQDEKKRNGLVQELSLIHI